MAITPTSPTTSASRSQSIDEESGRSRAPLHLARAPLHLADVTMRSAVWSATRTLIRETVAPTLGLGNRTPALNLPALRVQVWCMIAARDMTALRPEQPVRRRVCCFRCRWKPSARRPAMIGSAPRPVLAPAIRRRLRELIPGGQETQLELGLSPHAFGHVRKLVGRELAPRPVQGQAATLRVLLSHEANRLRTSREEPAGLWDPVIAASCGGRGVVIVLSSFARRP